MFYGRNNEYNILNNALKSPNNAIVVYGKRRVGKTTLIKEVIQKHDSIYYECIEDTLENNASLFKAEMIKQGIDVPSYINFNNFIDIFAYINSLNKKYVIVIDEYPYLKTLNNPKVVDSTFQNIIDNNLKNTNLIISGSSMRIMNEILTEGNALFGRFKEKIMVEELNYVESSSFYSNKSVYDKIMFYSIFGGSPFVNSSINPDISLKENIINNFLKNNTNVYNYADNMLLSDLANKVQARRIVSILANTKKKYSEIEAILDKEKTGKINVALKSLLELNVIKKVYPINKKNDSKKAYYEISDNALRFFYTYVNNNKSILSVIGEEAFYDQYIEKSLLSYVSYRFEGIVKNYFSIKVKKGVFKGVLDIGTYYYDDSINKSNGEFDVALKKEAGYEIYEVKFYKEPLKSNIIKKELEQIKQIKELNIISVGFVNVSGFEEQYSDCILLSGEDIYNI
ncbi:MAG: AAA family ATPase [Acholeplasmatales bacterium]|nr:AAA family ATPase [Acholeplasmatales bacterium]